MEELMQLTEQVLDELIKYNLTIEPSKIQWAKNEIEFLGHKVNEEGYAPSDKNIKKITNFKKPTSKKGVRAFIGLTNFFKNNIQNYAEIATPLTELTKENIPFKWNEKADEAFKKLQEIILQSPTLKAPDYTKPFTLVTDGSKVAISSILMQMFNGIYHPIEFFGRKLDEVERRYPAMKIELMAVFESVMHFTNILKGRHFTIITDAKTLTQNIDLSQQSDIIARWLIKLNEFSFDIEHIKGDKNPADYMSRNINTIENINQAQENLFQVSESLTESNIRDEQIKDKNLKIIIEAIKIDKNNNKYLKYQLNKNDTLILRQKINTQQSQTFIAPESLHNEIMNNAHKSHFAFKKTYELIKKRFYWVGMYRIIKLFCAQCERCNLYKNHATVKVPIQTVARDHPPGYKIIIDTVGPLVKSYRGNVHIFTIIDSASRYLEAIPLRNVNTQTIINCLNAYFARFGMATEIGLDNASVFKSKEFKDYTKNLNIKLTYGSIYHPTSQSKVERVHRDLKQSIACMAESTNQWDIKLEYFKLQHNTQINRSTGYSPSMLFFARELTIPFNNFKDEELINLSENIKGRLSMFKEVFQKAQINQSKTEEEYNKNSTRKSKEFKIGDTVYLKQLIKTSSLQPNYSGPYIVERVLRSQNYVIKSKKDDKLKSVRIHISKLFAPACINER